MKKIFSTVAMAIVAFTAVVSMSSCQNDSPSSFNAAPEIPATQTTLFNSQTCAAFGDYSYSAVISDDALALFDVKATVTTESDTKTIKTSDFTSSAKIVSQDMFDKTEVAGKACSACKTNLQSGKTYNVTVTFTLKSNFEEILKGMNKEEVNLYAQPNFTSPNKNCSQPWGTKKSVSSCNADYLQGIGDRLATTLSI